MQPATLLCQIKRATKKGKTVFKKGYFLSSLPKGFQLFLLSLLPFNHLINRPGGAGAVLSTASLLIN